MKQLLILISIFALVACNSVGHMPSDDTVAIIDVPKALKNPITNFSELIDSSWLVMLNTPAENAQGFITKVLLNNNKIYTLDELQSRTLNVYDNNGAFLYAIAKLGKGPQEVLNITDFSVTDDEVFVTDILQKRMQVYSAHSGSYLRTIAVPFTFEEVQQISPNKYLFALSPYNEEAGNNYLTHQIVITDSTFTPISFQIQRPATDMGSVDRSIWNIICGANSAFSMFSEAIYRYNPKTDSMDMKYYFDYGSDNPSEDARSNYRAYMNYYSEEPMSITTESPIVGNKYIVGQIIYNRDKYFMISDGYQTFTKKLLPDNYAVMEPLFPIGITNDDVLISNVEPTLGIPLLINKKIPVNGQVLTQDKGQTILLFSKLK